VWSEMTPFITKGLGFVFVSVGATVWSLDSGLRVKGFGVYDIGSWVKRL